MNIMNPKVNYQKELENFTLRLNEKIEKELADMQEGIKRVEKEQEKTQKNI